MIWSACYKIPTGDVDARGRPVFRRVQRSTGLTDKTRALQVAISFERAAEQVAEKRWTEQSALRFLNEVKSISGVTIGQIQETEGFLNKWVESRRKMAADSTWKNFKSIVRDFLQHLGPRAKGPLVDITPRVVAEFRDAEVAAGKAGSTVNKALSVLGQAFEEGVTQQALEKNPARNLRVKNAGRSAQTREFFTFDQFRELVRRTGPREKSRRGNTVHPDWQTFIVGTGYTGGRQQEVAQLRWEHVDFKKGVIGLQRSKNDDVHWMPLHPSLLAHLQTRKKALKGKGGELVMPHLAALTARKISKIFRETILPRVGISQPYAKHTEEKGVGRTLAKYSIHSLRHSLSTWLNDAGVPEMQRMRLIGHEDVGVNRKYTHTELEQASAAISRVPKL